jgi:hypothetical protein
MDLSRIIDVRNIFRIGSKCSPRRTSGGPSALMCNARVELAIVYLLVTRLRLYIIKLIQKVNKKTWLTRNSFVT